MHELVSVESATCLYPDRNLLLLEAPPGACGCVGLLQQAQLQLQAVILDVGVGWQAVGQSADGVQQAVLVCVGQFGQNGLNGPQGIPKLHLCHAALPALPRCRLFPAIGCI